MAVDIKQMTNLRLKINQLEREKKQSKDDVESVELLDKLIKKYERREDIPAGSSGAGSGTAL